MNMPEFRPARSAGEAHQSLRQSLEIQDQAQYCAVLWFAEIFQRGLYRDLGFSSMNQYAEEGLGFSHSRTRDFMQLAKVGPVVDKGEWLLDIVERSLNTDPVLLPRGSNPPPHQIHIHECPGCTEARVASPRGEILLSAAEKEVAHCDAQIHRASQANKATIPPKTRREVLARDRNQCRRKGCQHTRRLHIHHLETRADGGSNDIENLVTLCAGCHHLWHEQGGDLRALLTTVPDGR